MSGPFRSAILSRTSVPSADVVFGVPLTEHLRTAGADVAISGGLGKACGFDVVVVSIVSKRRPSSGAAGRLGLVGMLCARDDSSGCHLDVEVRCGG